MMITHINNQFISDWIYANLDANRSHNSKHLLPKNPRTNHLNPYEKAVAQALTLMIRDDDYDKASIFLTDNSAGLGSYIHDQMLTMFNDSKQRQWIHDTMSSHKSISLNIPLPRIDENDSNSPKMGAVCFTLNRENLTITQELTDSFVVKLAPDRKYSLSYEDESASSFEEMLSTYHIATIYPTTKHTMHTIGDVPNSKPVNPKLDMVKIFNAIDPRLTMAMPLCERFAWVTSNMNIKSRHVYLDKGLMTFANVGGHNLNDGSREYSHHVSINTTSAKYASADPVFSNHMMWHDLQTYSGDNKKMIYLQKQCIELIKGIPGRSYTNTMNHNNDYSL